MRDFHHRLLAAGSLALAIALLNVPTADAKRTPPPEPDLRIVQVTLSPEPYEPQQGVLQLTIQIELPEHLDDTTLLEVSSLLNSPSKRSVRFLTSRQPVGAPAGQTVTGNPSGSGKPRTSVVLIWDGTDQNKEFARSGRYHYEVRAKLLAAGEKSPRTLMLSWPKRGVIDVK
ncbi:MAG TPA: hypothetical protein VES96_05325 [Nitrospiraceae bacterium]|nr:hypothetical protein [Nitrospiraceae bacterium]